MLLLPVCIDRSLTLNLAAFLAFEVCVGIFWPVMGTLRSQLLPEELRSTTMNLFRIPLNLIVVTVLLMDISSNLIFVFCSISLFAASAIHLTLETLLSRKPKHSLSTVEKE